MKNSIKIFALIFALNLSVPAIFAQGTPNVQKALEDVKEQVNDLVTAKDENNPNELALRIETFKKVLDLSITEAKDLKIKFLTADFDKNDKALLPWRDKVSDALTDAGKYYEEQKQNLGDKEKTIALEDIKTIAQDFKNWRETNYLTAADQINNFLLIQQEAGAIQVAKKRVIKIKDDIIKIQKINAKTAGELSKLLNKADQLIKESDKVNQEAEKNFRELYIEPKPVITEVTTIESTSTKSETEENTSTTTLSKKELAVSNENATTTGADSEKTAQPISPPSIRDLVKDSLTKVKEAYRVFIEMSNLVRKLLK